MHRIGIDLGGTKIEGVLLAPDGSLIERQRIATPAGDYSGTLSAIRALVISLEQHAGTSASVGIGTPGAISPASGLLRNANSTCLNGQPLRQDLEDLLGRELRIANDADCLALSEAINGAGRQAQTVFGVIIGTGTGGGIVIERRLLTGPNAVAGEWGHNPLPWQLDDERPGPTCYCGKQGCIETYLSGPGMQADHLTHTGQRLTAIEINRRATAGDPEALATLHRYIDRMARALASVINILDPQVIVLGGGLSQISTLYQRVPEHWSRYVFSDTVRTRLLPPELGDASGVFGAAQLWD